MKKHICIFLCCSGIFSRHVNCCFFPELNRFFEARLLVWRFATNTSSMAAWVPYELNPHVVNYRVRSLVSQIIHMLRDTSKLPPFRLQCNTSDIFMLLKLINNRAPIRLNWNWFSKKCIEDYLLMTLWCRICNLREANDGHHWWLSNETGLLK